MPDETNIPTAKLAGHVPMLWKYVIPAAVLTACMMVSCACGVSGTWMAMRGTGNANQKGKVIELIGIAPQDNATWQDMHDDFVKKEFDLYRLASKRTSGMWFGLKSGRFGRVMVEELDTETVYEGHVLIEKAENNKEAKRIAADIIDRLQRQSFAYGPFVFVRGDQNLIAKMKTAFNK